MPGPEEHPATFAWIGDHGEYLHVIFKDTGEHAVFGIAVLKQFDPLCLRLQRIFRRGQKASIDVRRLAGEPDPDQPADDMAWETLT